MQASCIVVLSHKRQSQLMFVKFKSLRQKLLNYYFLVIFLRYYTRHVQCQFFRIWVNNTRRLKGNVLYKISPNIFLDKTTRFGALIKSTHSAESPKTIPKQILWTKFILRTGRCIQAILQYAMPHRLLFNRRFWILLYSYESK